MRGLAFLVAAAALGFPGAAIAQTAATAPADERAALAWARGESRNAIALWVQEAKAGNADGFYNIGQAYHFGRGVAKDDTAALGFYRQAHAAGHPRAAEQLGLILYGIPDRRVEAIQFLQEASRGGSAAADYVLGMARARGTDMQRDLALAFLYLSRAANGGIARAERPLSVVRFEMTPDDRSRALRIAFGDLNSAPR